MIDEVEELSKSLLNCAPDPEKLRADAAKKLADYWLDVRAFNALYSICAFPDIYAIEGGLLSIAGESIGKIISIRDISEDPLKHYPLDPKYFDAFHPQALVSALSVLTESQRGVIGNFAVRNTLCSAVLALYFYHESYRAAMVFEGMNPSKAIWNAKNAINFFNRFKGQEKKFEHYFDDIIMHIIAGDKWTDIYSLFMNLLRNYSLFDVPGTTFEKYARFHIMLLAKLVCRDFSNIQPLFAQLKAWITNNLPEDADYIRILELIWSGDTQEAHKAIEELKQKPKKDNLDESSLYFYKSWTLAVSWLIKQRLF